MGQKIFTIIFILCVFGLLVLNRVRVDPQIEARVIRDWSHSTNKTSTENKVFRQGETVHTGKGEFLELTLGDGTIVFLDENTNLQLKSLSKNSVRVGFGHGRILVKVKDGDRLDIDTPTAQNEVISRASFIGYDFKHETSVIPLSGSIRTTIPLLDRTLDVTSPITIHDVNPPTVENIAFDEKNNARKEFYAWTEQK